MPNLTIPETIQDWTSVPSIEGDFTPDARCAPAKPSLQWHKLSGNKLEPRENQLEAAQYEQAWLPDGYSRIFRSYVFGPWLLDYGSATLCCKI